MVLNETRESGLELGQVVEARIERIAHGGEGVAHVEGLVVFVPWTAPGDRVRAEIVERQPRWARARRLEVLEPSPERVEPGCPVFGVCGGCQLQHLSWEDQRGVKARAVADALARIGRLTLPEPVQCLAAAAPWHYRQRATFSWLWKGGRLAFGFHAAAWPVDPASTTTCDIIDVHACPVFVEAGNTRLAALREVLATELADHADPVEGRVALRAPSPDLVQCGVFTDDVKLAERLARASAQQASIPVTWGRWIPGGRLTVAAGAPRLHARLHYRGLSLRAGFDSFLQADLVGAERLYDAVLEELRPHSGDRVIDGYAGIGVLACELAARGVAVTAIESHVGAAADLRANAAALASRALHFTAGSRTPKAGRVHVLELPVERVDWSQPRPTAIVVNPPRTGCAARVLEAITKSPARRLVYVACEPTTLARDLRRLSIRWRLVSVRAFDLFPQTAHVETVARLER
jgi:23S rRNA (uracil1939-C5)-methyltransferase